MNSQEIYVMEQHTRALKEHTLAMNKLAQILELVGSKQYIAELLNAANTNMSAARRIADAADEISGVAKVYVQVAESNENAATKMLEASERILNAN